MAVGSVMALVSVMPEVKVKVGLRARAEAMPMEVDLVLEIRRENIMEDFSSNTDTINKIEWHEQIRDIGQLKPCEYNPRTITASEIKRIKESIQSVGYNERLMIDTDNVVISGHQRLKVLKTLKFKEIKVLVPNKKLTEKEFKQVMIRANITNGDFDPNLLESNFELPDLSDWGVSESLFPSVLDEQPGTIDDQGKLSQLEPKYVTCPDCGSKFDTREQE